MVAAISEKLKLLVILSSRQKQKISIILNRILSLNSLYSVNKLESKFNSGNQKSPILATKILSVSKRSIFQNGKLIQHRKENRRKRRFTTLNLNSVIKSKTHFRNGCHFEPS